MVQLGRPGVGEQLLAEHGFTDVRRVEIPFAWEFADPELYARTLASTGPAYEAIQAVGEAAFLEHARTIARERVRDGLPLRAEINVVGYLARRPEEPVTAARDEPSGSFLAATPATPAAEQLRTDDLNDLGYVMNVSRLWGRLPDAKDGLFDLLGQTSRAAGLTPRQRGILVVATASTLGDSYCSLAWGGKLAAASDPTVSAGVLHGDDAPLDESERALATWARAITRDPNATTAADIDALRAAGLDDQQIFAATVFIALRLAFSTVNDALGALPDQALVDGLPPEVRAAVTWGRPVQD
jgi:alkylhydroperoxidase family enzyme